ncbi:MAG: hypothetical protein J6P98_04995, partial [Clostridia bacterium]|nr:hypothetical protein [Clostridia bacterium]
LLTKICGNCRDLLDCTEEQMADYIEQASRIPKERAERAVEELVRLQLDLKLVSTPRTLVESTLLKICRPEGKNELIEIADRVNVLESSFSGVAEKAAIAARRAAESVPRPVVKPQEDAADPASEPASEAPAVTQLPDSTPDADKLFSDFRSALLDAEPTVYYLMPGDTAHWVSDKVLHICFNEAGKKGYEYCSIPDIRSILRETAKASIAPYTVEMEVRSGALKQNKVTELFGVPIEEE